MAVYNGAQYLEEAVMSILGQSFPDFEFIIINDGSTDKSADMLDSFSANDKRIQIFHQANQGLPAALNRGIAAARGKYIARMDADDVSLPDRLGVQYTFLENNPEVGVLGTQFQKLTPEGQATPSQWLLPGSPGLTAWRMLFRCCICHPSTMIRACLLRSVGGYDASVAHGQDYELWTRLVPLTQLMNHQQILFQFRRGHESVTRTSSDHQHRLGIRSAFRLHRRYIGGSADQRVAEFWRVQQHAGARSASDQCEFGVAELIAASRYLRSLLKAVLRHHWWESGEVVKIKEDARGKLLSVAHELSRRQGKVQAGLLKVRAHALLPGHVPARVFKAFLKR